MNNAKFPCSMLREKKCLNGEHVLCFLYGFAKPYILVAFRTFFLFTWQPSWSYHLSRHKWRIKI